MVGFIASFFVKESTYITLWMLSAILISMPLFVLAVVNNKAELVESET